MRWRLCGCGRCRLAVGWGWGNRGGGGRVGIHSAVVSAEGALVEAGDGGFEAIEALFEIGALAIERGEHLIVLLLNLICQGEIAGADAITGLVHAFMEFGAGDVFGLGLVAADVFFGNSGGCGDQCDEEASGGAGGGGNLGKHTRQ